MMCDNISLYKTYIPSPTTPSTTITPQFYPLDDDGGDEQRPYMNNKRKLSDYEDNNSSLVTYDQICTPFIHDNIRNDDEEDEDDDDVDDDDDASSEDEDVASDDESNSTHSLTHVTTPCTIIQRRHSDTIPSSYSSPIVKRRCTYSSMHDEEQKRSVLIESYRKLRGVKKPKLQVSLLICNLIKQLERTFAKTPQIFPPRQQLQQQQQQQQQQQHVQYYQQRTTYRSSSSDSIYMSPSSLTNDELTNPTTTNTSISNQQYSPPHTSTYDSDKMLIPVGDLRTSHTMYHHPSTTDAYWLAQSNFAIPVVSTSDDDDVDVSLQDGGDYLDLSDNTLASSFSSCSSSSPSVSSSSQSTVSELISNECCCSSTSTTAAATSSSSSSSSNKLLVDTNNNTNDDYYLYQQQTYHQHHQQQQHYSHFHSPIHFDQDSHSNHHHHHHHSSSTEQAFFYHHNGSNTVDIITTA